MPFTSIFSEAEEEVARKKRIRETPYVNTLLFAN
jgi:hypothetical protein